MARFAIKVLHDQGVFARKAQAHSFLTLASPHCGVRRNNYTAYGFLFNKAARLSQYLSPRFFGRLANGVNIQELLGHRPLLRRMVEDDFLAALSLFRHITTVGCVSFDHLVSHSTACISRAPPLLPTRRGRRIEFAIHSASGFEPAAALSKTVLAPLLLRRQEWADPANNQTFVEQDIVRETDGSVVFDADVMDRLGNLPWRRISVITGSPSAHNFLIGKGMFNQTEAANKWLTTLSSIIVADMRDRRETAARP